MLARENKNKKINKNYMAYSVYKKETQTLLDDGQSRNRAIGVVSLLLLFLPLQTRPPFLLLPKPPTQREM
jgi:hypothetical protein